MERPTVFRCVPLRLEWVSNQKLDLNAIYRRPVRENEWTTDQAIDPATGLPKWDFTGPLPLRRHMDYVKKGFEYVTLADRKSLADVAGDLRALGYDPAAFVMDARTGGPWNDQFYLSSQVQVDRAQMDVLKGLVDRHGSEAVEQARQIDHPGYRLPLPLRGLKPGDVSARDAEQAVAAVTSTTTATAVVTAAEPPKKRGVA